MTPEFSHWDASGFFCRSFRPNEFWNQRKEDILLGDEWFPFSLKLSHGNRVNAVSEIKIRFKRRVQIRAYDKATHCNAYLVWTSTMHDHIAVESLQYFFSLSGWVNMTGGVKCSLVYWFIDGRNIFARPAFFSSDSGYSWTRNHRKKTKQSMCSLTKCELHVKCLRLCQKNASTKKKEKRKTKLTWEFERAT